jgi:DMSO/TMAO reductase YedYZ molybdopterin-dependent catalytic subunit
MTFHQDLQALPALPVHGASPRASGEDRVVVDGLVRHPRTFLPSDLAAFPWVSLTDDFTCLEGWYVPALHWHGVALAAVLDAVGVDGQCIEVSARQYTTLLSREEADRAVLALWLGDAPVPAEHGGPVRLIVPGRECYTSVKWVDRITVHEAALMGAARSLVDGIARARQRGSATT